LSSYQSFFNLNNNKFDTPDILSNNPFFNIPNTFGLIIIIILVILTSSENIFLIYTCFINTYYCPELVYNKNYNSCQILLQDLDLLYFLYATSKLLFNNRLVIIGRLLPKYIITGSTKYTRKCYEHTRDWGTLGSVAPATVEPLGRGGASFGDKAMRNPSRGASGDWRHVMEP
jgi:hypothetical protein